MSEFILIVPAGWTKLDWQEISTNVSGINTGAVLDWINANYYVDLEEKLKTAEYIPADSSLVSAKLIDDSYFLVQLG